MGGAVALRSGSDEPEQRVFVVNRDDKTLDIRVGSAAKDRRWPYLILLGAISCSAAQARGR